MYSYFWEKNKIFLAIIIGAAIIGGFIYFACLPVRQGLKNSSVVVAPKNVPQLSRKIRRRLRKFLPK